MGVVPVREATVRLRLQHVATVAAVLVVHAPVDVQLLDTGLAVPTGVCGIAQNVVAQGRVVAALHRTVNAVGDQVVLVSIIRAFVTLCSKVHGGSKFDLLDFLDP